MILHMRRSHVVAIVVCLALVGTLVVSGLRWYRESQAASAALSVEHVRAPEESNPRVRFLMEVFDIVMREYWQKLSERDAAQHFRAALVQVVGDPSIALVSDDRAGLAARIARVLAQAPEEKRAQLVRDTAIAALGALVPQGRSGLMSDAQEKEFRDQVAHIDDSRNLYQTLGVAQGASVDVVQRAYQEKAAELAASSSPEAQAALEQVAYAKDVLSATTTKALYDQAKIEPSLVSAMPDSHTLYLDLRQVTPGSFAEFQQAVTALPTDSAIDSLIIDLRGNIGGTLDFARYLAGLFVGPNQYAFDLYHQGDLQVQRTPIEVAAIPALQRMQHVALLVNGMTQSTAELTAALFERQRLGVVVGERTRGWGTVENTFPIETDLGDGVHYAVLLVHSATIRPDGQSIENLGVTPDVDISHPKWRAQLSDVVHSERFAALIAKILEK